MINLKKDRKIHTPNWNNHSRGGGSGGWFNTSNRSTITYHINCRYTYCVYAIYSFLRMCKSLAIALKVVNITAAAAANEAQTLSLVIDAHMIRKISFYHLNTPPQKVKKAKNNKDIKI